jgi:hypothetical protein
LDIEQTHNALVSLSYRLIYWTEKNGLRLRTEVHKEIFYRRAQFFFAS